MITPQGSYLTISYNSLTSVLFCESLDETTISEYIVRPEYEHDKQRSALENTGVKPIYADLLGGEPNQIIYGNNCTPRDLTPDDSDLDNIFQKFFIQKYVFTGLDSSDTDIQQMLTAFKHFKSLRDKFEAHKAFSGGGVSIQFLQNILQPDNFTYFSTTGLTIVGSSLGTQSNLFLNNFSANLARDIYKPVTKKFWKWSAEFYSVSLQAMEATV
jgi:hypothetical protein